MTQRRVYIPADITALRELAAHGEVALDVGFAVTPALSASADDLDDEGQEFVAMSYAARHCHVRSAGVGPRIVIAADIDSGSVNDHDTSADDTSDQSQVAALGKVHLRQPILRSRVSSVHVGQPVNSISDDSGPVLDAADLSWFANQEIEQLVEEFA
jgi:hypothetical protein